MSEDTPIKVERTENGDITIWKEEECIATIWLGHTQYANLFANAEKLLEALKEAEDSLTKSEVEEYGTITQLTWKLRKIIAETEEKD